MRYPSSVLKVVLCGLDYAGMGGRHQNAHGYKRVMGGMWPPHSCKCYGRISIKPRLTGKSCLIFQYVLAFFAGFNPGLT